MAGAIVMEVLFQIKRWRECRPPEGSRSKIFFGYSVNTRGEKFATVPSPTMRSESKPTHMRWMNVENMPIIVPQRESEIIARTPTEID